MKQRNNVTPFHLQDYVKEEIANLLKTWNSGKTKDIAENRFASPVMITGKKEKLVEVAFNSRNLIDTCKNGIKIVKMGSKLSFSEKL